MLLGKVNLTWDETDPERQAAMKRSFDLLDKNESDEDEDLKAYLAMSSSADEDETEESGTEVDGNASGDEANIDGSNSDKVDRRSDALEIYRNAIKRADGRKSTKRNERNAEVLSEDTKGNMEMKFTSKNDGGDQTTMSRDIKQKIEEKMTPWEKYLTKKRDKQKAKREARKLARPKEDELTDLNGVGAPFSDDELPGGSHICKDAFFQHLKK